LNEGGTAPRSKLALADLPFINKLPLGVPNPSVLTLLYLSMKFF
jgi:hypothetical protein